MRASKAGAKAAVISEAVVLNWVGRNLGYHCTASRRIFQGHQGMLCLDSSQKNSSILKDQVAIGTHLIFMTLYLYKSTNQSNSSKILYQHQEYSFRLWKSICLICGSS
jgi:hypothetical protein